MTREPSIVLKAGSLDGRPPQEVFIVEVQHGVVEVTHPWTIQMVNNGGVLGVFVDDVGAGMRVPSLVGTRNRYLMDTIGVLGNSRHSGRR